MGKLQKPTNKKMVIGLPGIYIMYMGKMFFFNTPFRESVDGDRHPQKAD